MKNICAKLIPIAICMLAVGCSNQDSKKGVYYEVQVLEEVGLPAPLPGISADGDQFEEFEDNPFITVAEEPVSTFSVDADGASYGVMRRYINDGFSIDPASVRIEEFLNYFTFEYAQPQMTELVEV